jgi:hypothetical protein
MEEWLQRAVLRSVTADAVEVDGRKALMVSLANTAARGIPNVDFIDMPTYVRLPVDFENGTISVDIMSRLRTDAPDYARGFAGIAYRIAPDDQAFECVYARPANGRQENPPSPRDRRAIQYFAFPEWKFDRLRTEHPDGPYEAGADIGLGKWFRLQLEVSATTLRATIDGNAVLSVPQTKAVPQSGALGLWVDIGTEAYFANLEVRAQAS